MALAQPKTCAVSAEDIVRELEAARYRPDAALRAAVQCADQIAPAVAEVVNLAADGVYLLPRQENLLFWGIHAVAAGRRTELYQPLVRWLRQASDDELDRLLGDADTENLTGILLSAFDGDATPIIDMCLNPKVGSVARWAALGTLARLTFGGTVARHTMVDVLTRFEREQLAAPRSLAWQGWQQAVVLLGVEELRERMHATWEDGRNPERKIDQDDHDLTLSKARALAPGDASLFEADHIVAIDDPVAALHWVTPKPDNQDDRAAGRRDSDLGALFALRDDEIGWLRGYLDHKYPPSIGVLEILDGYFCGLIVAPGTARCADYLPKFWKSSPLSAVHGVHRFDSAEHKDYVDALMTRHWSAIAHDFGRGHRHTPLLQDNGEVPEAQPWALGFAFAITLRASDWERARGDEMTGDLYVAVASLAGRAELLQRKLSDRERCDIVDALPVALQSIYDRNHGRIDPFMRPPIPLDKAGIKFGRNDPCPCCSGKKYKRCCGSPDKQLGRD